MPIRLQADADLNQIIVSAVLRRAPAIDFRTATAAGLAGLNDLEVLALGARDDRILVTLTSRPCLGILASSCRRGAVLVSSSFPSILQWEKWRTI